jgi:hypothetical protein
MPDANQTEVAFERLSSLLAPYRDQLVVKTDEPGHLSLDAPPSPPYPKGLFFGAVKIGKRYVSFHLVPVYVYPDLLDAISPVLRKRMQGKSCFHFTAPDDALFLDLGRLTEAGFHRYKRDGLLAASRPIDRTTQRTDGN